MDKFTRTIIAYLASISLQIVCFVSARISVLKFNNFVNEHNNRVREAKESFWKRVFTKIDPEQTEYAPISEWFAIDNWTGFKVDSYDLTELVAFIVLFTLTALVYIVDKNLKGSHPMLRTCSLLFSLLSGYVILYEIIALF